MEFIRYVVREVNENGTLGRYHCIGLPNDAEDIRNALLMDEKALKKCLDKNFQDYQKYRDDIDAGIKKPMTYHKPHVVIKVVCTTQ